MDSRRRLFHAFFNILKDLDSLDFSLTVLPCSISLEGCLAFNSQIAAPNLDSTCGHRCTRTKRFVFQQNIVSKMNSFRGVGENKARIWKRTESSGRASVQSVTPYTL